MPDYVERAPSDYADVEALVAEGKLDEAEELAATKTLSGEDKTIVADLIASAKERAAAEKKASKAKLTEK